MKFNNIIARNNVDDPIRSYMKYDYYDPEAKIAQVKKNRHDFVENRKRNLNLEVENILESDFLLHENRKKELMKQKWL